MNDLDTKNGKRFEAATEYLYRKKIEELEAEVAKLQEALQEISNSRYTEATAMDLIELAIGALGE